MLEYVLDGFEAALELERELGVRSVEIDRGLLTAPAALPARSVESAPRTPPPAPRTPHPAPSTPHQAPSTDLVFLHDRPLSGKGVEMMAKIITAMGRTAETAPIVVVPPVPRAKVVVVLGGLAMRKYFPTLKGEPGQWLKSAEGLDVLVTYSPEYILRFSTVTPAVEKIKKDMWRSLKAVVQRLG